MVGGREGRDEGERVGEGARGHCHQTKYPSYHRQTIEDRVCEQSVVTKRYKVTDLSFGDELAHTDILVT